MRDGNSAGTGAGHAKMPRGTPVSITSVRKLYKEATLAYYQSKPNRQKQMNVYRTWTPRILVCLYQILITPLEKKKKKSSICYTPLLTLHFKVYHHHHYQLCRLQVPCQVLVQELEPEPEQVQEQGSQ